MATTRQEPIQQPTNWAYSIQTNIDQDLPALALQTISGLINAHHIPLIHHFQFLLYLVLEPPTTRDAAGIPDALTLLYRYLDVLRASSLAPLLPSLEGKAWLHWSGSAHALRQTYPRRVRARMETCEGRGIWALVFERSAEQMADEQAKWDLWREEDEADEADGFNGQRLKKIKGARTGPSSRAVSRLKTSASGSRASSAPTDTRRSRRLPKKEDDDMDVDNNDEEASLGNVTPQGWALLEFLVALWTKDASENGGVSPSFLSQLWRPSVNMPYSQANDVVEIVRQAAYNSTGAEAVLRQRIAAGLLKLLVDATTAEPSRFLATNLTTALASVFQHPRVPLLLATLRAPLASREPRTSWQPAIAYGPLTHFLVHAIEKAAGVRMDRENTRLKSLKNQKLKRSGNRRSIPVATKQFTSDGLAAPTVEYAIELLDLSPEEQEESQASNNMSTERTMRALKLALVQNLAANVESGLWDGIGNNDKMIAGVLHAIKRARELEAARKEREDDDMETQETLPLGSMTPTELGLSP